MKVEVSLWRERAWLIAPAILFFLGNFAYFLGGRAVDSSRTEALARARSDARSRLDAAEQAEKKALADAERVEGIRLAEEEFFGKRIGNLNDTIAATVSDSASRTWMVVISTVLGRPVMRSRPRTWTFLSSGSG